MVISDSYSDKTSSTLPIIISFSSHLKTNKIKQIRNILSHHPNCQKYVTKGPNFVADGINEFRLYYVDSSLYSDDITLKKLTVEKEEIVFGDTTDDSLEPPYNISKPRKLPSLYSNENSVRIEIPKRYDESTKCTQHSRCYPSAVEIPRVMKKVSKSFQIGPDLRFNVVYVNTEIPTHSFNYKTTEASAQTEQVENQNIQDKLPEVCSYSTDSSMKIPVRDSPSFSFRNHSKPVKKEPTTFRTFCSKMEEKKVFKFKDSEINVESRTTSVKYSIKKSPSFLANYILEILNTRTPHENLRNPGIFEQSVVNYLKLDDFKKRIGATKTHDLGMKNDIVQYDKSLKYDRKSPHKGEVNKKNNYKHRKKDEKMEQNNEYTKNYNYIDKFRRYHNTIRPNCYKVHCLFKCTNMDFFFRRSHYAILKKYHRKLQENRHKREKHHHHNHRHKRDNKKQIENEIGKRENLNSKEYNTHYQKLLVHTCQGIPHHRKTPSGESRTKTTISAFLQSYRPWHWKDNSKLSVCFDEEFSTG